MEEVLAQTKDNLSYDIFQRMLLVSNKRLCKCYYVYAKEYASSHHEFLELSCDFYVTFYIIIHKYNNIYTILNIEQVM